MNLRPFFLTIFGLMLFSATLFASRPLFDTAVNYNVGKAPFSVAAADLDNDGDIDLVTANSGDSTVSVLMNNGDGTFAPKVDYMTGCGPFSVYAADFDGDGDQDLVTANAGTLPGGGGNGNTASILKNKGNGIFDAAVDYETGLNPVSVFASDLDGDFDLDLIVANNNSHLVSVLKNNGDGTFTPKVDYMVEATPFSVYASDLDGDGDNDLAVANDKSDSVSILKNNGDGSFAIAVNYASDVGPVSVFASDLDGDSDFDLVAGNFVAGTVSVFKNNGNGTFTSRVLYVLQTFCFSVFASDLDNDGDVDLAVASSFPGLSLGAVSILINNGNGIFAPKVDYRTGAFPRSVVVSDLDGDGDQDVATANFYGNSVSILRNLTICSIEKGDLNRDSILNLSDVALMLNCVFLDDGNCALCFSDVNCDGILTSTDVVLELNKIFLGQPFPC